MSRHFTTAPYVIGTLSILIFLNTVASAQVALYVAGNTSPAPNPDTQGWNSKEGRNAMEYGITVDPPEAAWGLNSHTGREESFDRSGLFATYAGELAGGFSAQMRMSIGGVTTGTDPLSQSNMIVRNGQKVYDLYWHQDGAHAGSGNGGFYYQNAFGTATLIEAIEFNNSIGTHGESTMHDYEVRVDGVGNASFFEDGSQIGVTVAADDFADTTEDLFGAIAPAAGANVGESRFFINRLSLSGGAGPPLREKKWWSADSGDWFDNFNWSSGAPLDHTETAILGDAISAPRTIFVDTPVTVRSVRFDHGVGYNVSGQGSVNLESQSVAEGFNAGVDVRQTAAEGAHQFQAPVRLHSLTDVNVTDGAELIFTNLLDLNGNTLTKKGAGTMSIRSDFVTGGGTLNIAEGAVSGNGTVGGSVNNSGGTISPGNTVTTTVGQVPEPSAFALLVLGSLLVCWRYAGSGRKNYQKL